MIVLLVCLAALAAAVVLVPLALLLGSALLFDEHPERYLSDPAARRRALLS